MNMVEFHASGRARKRDRATNLSGLHLKNAPLLRRYPRKSKTPPRRKTTLFTMTGYLRTFRDYLRDRSLRFLGVLMSLNDPQWGRRPNQGPPDLDEIWRDFNRKLGGLFGRGEGGDGDSKGPSA